MLAYFNQYFTTQGLVTWVTIAHNIIYKYKGKDTDGALSEYTSGSSFLFSFGDLINSLINEAPAAQREKTVNENLSQIFRFIGHEEVKTALAEIGSAYLFDHATLTDNPGNVGKFLHQLACLAALSEMDDEYEIYLDIPKRLRVKIA